MESKTVSYQGYQLQLNGWHGCVVMRDRYGDCIGATHNEEQARAWIDKLENRRFESVYRSQTATNLRLDGSVSRQNSNRRS